MNHLLQELHTLYANLASKFSIGQVEIKILKTEKFREDSSSVEQVLSIFDFLQVGSLINNTCV